MNGHPKKRRGAALGVLIITVLFVTVCIIPVYFIAEALFRVTGRPPLLPMLILITAFGFVIAFAILRFIGYLMHKYRAQKEQYRYFTKAMGDTIDALDRIATGDFDVLIDVDEDDHFRDLALKINEMAKNLSSMEHMRQDFVSNVSHEFQSPLTSIKGYAQLLRKENLSAGRRAHYIDTIEAEATRLSGLADNLLRLSLLDADDALSDMRPYRLDKQLEEIILMMEPQWAAKNLDLQIELMPACAAGDEELLAQVWINLLHNAIKFTPEGGEITIALSQADGWITCRISDTGIGMGEEDLMHIFERFYKADKSRERNVGGSGLGLALVKKIISIHGGKLSVQSTPGSGTTFFVTLHAGDIPQIA